MKKGGIEWCCSGVFIVKFGHILVSLLLPLNR